MAFAPRAILLCTFVAVGASYAVTPEACEPAGKKHALSLVRWGPAHSGDRRSMLRRVPLLRGGSEIDADFPLKETNFGFDEYARSEARGCQKNLNPKPCTRVRASARQPPRIEPVFIVPIHVPAPSCVRCWKTGCSQACCNRNGLCI